MADDAEIRRANFRGLWAEPFSPTSAATALWGSAALWSDLYHGRKSFGEKLARRIEEKVGLVRLSLDDPSGPQAEPISDFVLRHMSTLDPTARRRAENVLRAHFGFDPLPPPASDTRSKAPTSVWPQEKAA